MDWDKNVQTQTCTVTTVLSSTIEQSSPFTMFLLFYIQTSHVFALQCFETLVGLQEGHLACKKTGCWFVGGDDLTGAVHVL